jgi:RHS repeat-associated protein
MTISDKNKYGPFGEVIRTTGPMATINPLRFSTRYQDDEMGLFYYGYRYYKPSTGTWLNRDSAEEGIGGANLYGFANNAPTDNFDELGLLVGTVSILRFQPLYTIIHGQYWRGWMAHFLWSPPTTDAWAGACDCKPCKQVVWTQVISTGEGTPWRVDMDIDYSIKHKYYWGCSATDADGQMWDNPGVHGYVLWMLKWRSPRTWWAISSAVCTAGPDQGKIYAQVFWGYHWIYDSVPTGLGPIIH